MSKSKNEELKFIIKQLKQNRKSNFKNFFNKYNKLIYGIVFSILKNKEDTEDIVQQIFQKIYVLDNSKFPSNNEYSWLYTVSKNEAINFLKKKQDNINIDDIYNIASNENEINNIIDRIEYNRLISTLNSKEKEIISLKILSGFSFEEISKLVNEPIGTVKWRYYKTIHSLQLLLSNLSMFIITLIIGIKSLLKNQETPNQNIKQQTENNIKMTQNAVAQNTTLEENTKSQDKSFNDENNSYNEILQDEHIKQETIIEETPINNNINYTGITFLAISAMFFIMTIIFFVKYQLKGKKKMSK